MYISSNIECVFEEVAMCSAKTRDGVQEAFQELVHKVLQVPSLYSMEGNRDTVDPLASQPSSEENWCAGGACTVT